MDLSRLAGIAGFGLLIPSFVVLGADFLTTGLGQGFLSGCADFGPFLSGFLEAFGGDDGGGCGGYGADGASDSGDDLSI